MIETFIKDGKTYASIGDLFRWDKNPKIVMREDFDRLKGYLTEFGQFKPLLILDNGEVIGGNSRLEVMKEMGIKDVWVSIVAPKSDAQKLAISLADNDEVGRYVEEDLAALVMEYDGEINPKDYKINVGRDIDLEALLQSLGPGGEEPQVEDEEKKITRRTLVTCPHCGEEFDPNEKDE